MSLYAQLENGEIFKYPLSLYDIQSFHSNTSFVAGQLLLPPGYVEVVRHNVPTRLWHQKFVETNPIYNEEDNRWHQNFEIIEFTDNEKLEYITNLKKIKNTTINDWWQQANFNSFTYQHKQIDASLMARATIDATNGIISNTGKLPNDWLGNWKTKDNDWITIDTIDEWNAFYNALYVQDIENYKKAQTLKEYLWSEECNTPELIDNICWNEGE